MSGLVEGSVVRRREWTSGLVTLSITADVKPFVPGQFFNLGLDGGADAARRAYSAASAPNAPHLEFYLTEVLGGALTPRLCHLAEGDRVQIDPNPQGFFSLAWVPPARHLWLLATGTGLGPFISILRSGEAHGRFERIVVVHGVRSSLELGYSDELRALEGPQLAYVPALSRDGRGGLLSGRLPALLRAGEIERQAGLSLSPEDSHVMLCGNPGMIDDALALFAERGLRRHRTRKPGHITVERYWESSSPAP